MSKKVIIYHAIDTEGPLYESLDAKFERIEELFKIELDRTEENLRKLRNKEIDLGGIEDNIATVLSGHLTNYNDTWDKIDHMLNRLTKDEVRFHLPDCNGNGWVFNWHCIDHVNFDYNPRRRDIGYHNIHDHYVSYVEKNKELRDEIQWHFHPMSTYNDAHRCATSYTNSEHLHQILTRRVIEKEWFPSCFRAGFQVERPDSNHFLEQWIPFDISNMALDDNSELDEVIDFKNGRSGDWRLAPADWSLYHPSHDHWAIPGNSRRWIGRALNVLNRIAAMDQKEMDKAFKRASDGETTLVGLASHDFRNLETEVYHLKDLIKESSKKYPDVQFEYCSGVDAFRKTIWGEDIKKVSGYEPLDLSLEFIPASDEDVPGLKITTKSGKVFGPQPYLAIETKSRRFIHDNLDFGTDLKTWHYAFHSDSLPLEDVKRVGIAANDQYGNTVVRNIEMKEVL